VNETEGHRHPRPLGDEDELFRGFHRQLARLVRYRVNTSSDIVDDACTFAWMEFMRYQPDRERKWRRWLVTTAEREAWRLHGKEAAHVGFDDPGVDGLVHDVVDREDRLAIRSDLRAALGLLAAVPERRRQAKALQVMGYSLDEIGQLLGRSHTLANALVAEANAAMRREHLRVAPEQQPRSARAARLRELEQEPPRWLHAAVGRPPGKNLPAEAVLAWRRAALVEIHALARGAGRCRRSRGTPAAIARRCAST
jgi:hypothetical protein